jgi:uncharacterized protein YceH (UPF0502 family)
MSIKDLLSVPRRIAELQAQVAELRRRLDEMDAEWPRIAVEVKRGAN